MDDSLSKTGRESGYRNGVDPEEAAERCRSRRGDSEEEVESRRREMERRDDGIWNTTTGGGGDRTGLERMVRCPRLGGESGYRNGVKAEEVEAERRPLKKGAKGGGALSHGGEKWIDVVMELENNHGWRWRRQDLLTRERLLPKSGGGRGSRNGIETGEVEAERPLKTGARRRWR
jgi:hypothetical protein